MDGKKQYVMQTKEKAGVAYQYQDQESHVLPTEPARHPSSLYLETSFPDIDKPLQPSLLFA